MTIPRIYTQNDLDAALVADRKKQEHFAAIREFSAWNAALECCLLSCERYRPADIDRFDDRFYSGFIGALDTVRRAVNELKRGQDDYPRHS